MVRHDLAGESHRRAGERRMRRDAVADHNDVGFLAACSYSWTGRSNARMPLVQVDIVLYAVAA
jgi:hypothetical protein